LGWSTPFGRNRTGAERAERAETPATIWRLEFVNDINPLDGRCGSPLAPLDAAETGGKCRKPPAENSARETVRYFAVSLLGCTTHRLRKLRELPCYSAAMTDQALPDQIPDRLSTNPKSPHYDEALLTRGVGIKFDGQEKTNVEEYCVSEGWIRVAVGKTVDRKGNPLTIKLTGKVEPYFQK
jgi:hypothetical protein